MKIAIVSQPYDKVLPPRQNSIGLWSYCVAQRLARQADVTIYAYSRFRGHRFRHDGIRFVLLPVLLDRLRLKLFERLMRSPGCPAFTAPTYYAGYLHGVLRHLRAHPPDIVHIHLFPQWVPAVRYCCPRARIFLHIQSDWLIQLDPMTVGQQIGLRDLIMGCSEYILAPIRRAFPQMAARCRLIPNGVDLQHFCPLSNDRATIQQPRSLLFVGRISPEKGVHTLIDAYQRLATDYSDLQLELVGPQESAPREFLVELSADPIIRHLDGFYSESYVDHLRARIPTALRERVHLRGFITHTQLPSYYQQASILINPSYWEPFGSTVVEAMACGRPVVGTRVGGMKKTIRDGATGPLVERANPDALAAAVDTLLTQPELAASMGRAGRNRAKVDYSWDHIATLVWTQYEATD